MVTHVVETDKAGQRRRCEGVCGPAHVQFKIRGGVQAVTTEKATFEQKTKVDKGRGYHSSQQKSKPQGQVPEREEPQFI